MIRKYASPAKKEKDTNGYIFGINSSVIRKYYNNFFTTLIHHDNGSFDRISV